MKSYLHLFITVFSVLSSKAQGPPIEWQGMYSHLWEDSISFNSSAVLSEIEQTPDGGFIISAVQNQIEESIEWYFLSHTESALFKLDPNGSLQWSKTVDSRWFSPFIPFMFKVGTIRLEVTPDEGYLVRYLKIDTIESDISEDTVSLVKLDKNGNRQWELHSQSLDLEKLFLGRKNDTLNMIFDYAVKQDSILIICGNMLLMYDSITSVTNTQADSVKLEIYDLNKTLVFSKPLPDSIGKFLTDIKDLHDGGYFSINTQYYPEDSAVHTYISKFSSLFDVLSVEEISFPGFFKDVRQTSDDGFVILSDSTVIKIDSAYNFQWQNELSGFATALELAHDGGVLISGGTTGTQGDYWTVKYNNSGDIIWDKIHGTNAGEAYTSIAKTYDGGYIASGANTSRDNDVFVFKYEPDNYNRIYVQAFVDSNSNGVRDNAEPGIRNYFAQTTYGSDTLVNSPLSNEWGRIEVYDTGVFITRIVDIPYYQVTPVQQSSHFTAFFQTDTVYFAVSPSVTATDLKLSLVPLTGSREGRNTTYRVSATNAGTQQATGIITLIKDPRVEYVMSTPSEDNVTGDTITWNFVDLYPFDRNSWDITFLVGTPPEITRNDTIFTSAMISPMQSDATPGNNQAFLQDDIIGSYDPNDKDVNIHLTTPAGVNSGLYLDYIIRFQNTGNDTAFNVRIFDTLSNLLIHDSLDIVAYSHPAHLVIKEDSIMEWYFDNILLPDSNVNEPASHGYVIYRIKARNGLTDGTIIPNKAAIYFDYRDPVITNMTTTLVANPTLSSVGVIRILQGEMQIVPNPNKGKFKIELTDVPKGNYLLTINDVKGAEVFTGNILVNSHTSTLEIESRFPEGLYTLNIFSNDRILSRKMIIHN